MQSGLKPAGVNVAMLTSLIGGALCLAQWPIWSFLLTFVGLPDPLWARIFLLTRFLAFPLFLVSLVSLRWSCALIWANFLIGWVAGIVGGGPHGKWNPLGPANFVQFIGALSITASCLLIRNDSTYPAETRKNPSLVRLLRKH